MTDRDAKVFALYEQLVEIEQRLIPTGLHVFGRPSSAGEKTDLLKMIASFDRPEAGARAIPEELLDDAVRVFLENGVEAAVRLTGEASRPVFNLLETVCTKLQTNNEIDSLVRALRGEFIEPGPGADIIQNPDILPTGRNTHAINPYGVPSAAAFARSEAVANSLLDRYKNENGRYPEAMALVLWGLDNIKTQGEGVAQALWLLGVRPVRDGMNRVTNVEPLPLERLGRPRVDVVMTVSGIFRDLFGATMLLLDKAVRCVAELEEPAELNPVRANVEAPYQNIDSFEIGVTDVDHYFEYLGGVSKAVERHARERPAIYLSDALGREARVRSLEEAVRLETRAKTLNPKWYEGMLRHGFRGVAEIESHVTNTFGWSATTDAVDDWVYTEVARTYVLDERMLERLRRLNPHSARSLVGRLLEAEGRGFWEAETSVV